MDLPPASEEVAGFYGALIESDHAKDSTFNKNFFKDFLEVLAKNPPVCRVLCYVILRMLIMTIHSETARRSQLSRNATSGPCSITSSLRKLRRKL